MNQREHSFHRCGGARLQRKSELYRRTQSEGTVVKPPAPWTPWTPWIMFLQRRTLPKENFALGQRIGSGGFGFVHRAKLNGVDVVAKFLHVAAGETELSDEKKKELRSEATLLAGKRHVNIVGFLGFSKTLNCIVTAYCANRSLFDVIREAKRPANTKIRETVEDFNYRLRWLEGIAAALICLHHDDPYVIHRDLKSTNIFLDEHWVVKVGDFGLARIVDLFDSFITVGKLSDNSNLNLLYQPPEVIEGNLANPKRYAYSTASDVHCYGVLIQELITLKTPYGLESGTDCSHRIWATMLGIMNGKLRPEIPADRSMIPGRWEECLEPLVELMNRCCSFCPENRPDFKEIFSQISKIREEYRLTTPPEELPPTWSCKKVLFLVAVALSLLLLLAAILAYVFRDIKDSNHSSALFAIAVLAVGALLVVGGIFLGCQLKKKYLQLKESLKCLESNVDCLGSTLELVERLEPIEKETAAPLLPFSPFEEAERHNVHSLSLPMDGELMWYSVPQQWHTVCKNILNELPEICACPHAEAARRFCLAHQHCSIVQPDTWQQEFIRCCLESADIKRTAAWKEYETSCKLPPIRIDALPDSDPFADGPSEPKRPIEISCPQCLHQEAESTTPGSSIRAAHSLMFQRKNGDVEAGDEASAGLSHSFSSPSSNFPFVPDSSHHSQ